jgi:hypothetical protein
MGNDTAGELRQWREPIRANCGAVQPPVRNEFSARVRQQARPKLRGGGGILIARDEELDGGYAVWALDQLGELEYPLDSGVTIGQLPCVGIPRGIHLSIA